MLAGVPLSAECQRTRLLNGNVIKKNVSFFEVYGKVNYTFNDNFSLGGNAYYTPNFLNTRRRGTYASITGKCDRAEHLLRHQRRRHVCFG